MTYNICQNILFLAAIFKFKINGNDLFLNPIPSHSYNAISVCEIIKNEMKQNKIKYSLWGTTNSPS